jgi:hypothetical protein
MFATPRLIASQDSWWAGFPGPANTGPRGVWGAGSTQFTVVTPTGPNSSGTGWAYNSSGGGFVNVTSSNVTIQGLFIPYNLNINTQANVTISDCVIAYAGDITQSIGIKHTNTTNLTIQYCTIFGTANQGATGPLLVGIKDGLSGGIPSTGTIVQFCNIYNATTGLQGEEGQWLYNYIHDLGSNYVSPGNNPHLNGMTSNASGQTRYFLRIANNTVLCATDPSQNAVNPNVDPVTGGYNQTDAISLFEDSSNPAYPQANRLIENNLIGGGSYTLYCGQNTSGVPAYNVVARNNRFTTRYFSTAGSNGICTSFCKTTPSMVWQNNVFHETGTVIPLSSVTASNPGIAPGILTGGTFSPNGS